MEQGNNNLEISDGIILAKCRTMLVRKVLCISSGAGEAWKVHWQQDHMSSVYKDLGEAILAARNRVVSLEPGHVLEIRIHRSGPIRFESAWAYGRDPYPPAS